MKIEMAFCRDAAPNNGMQRTRNQRVSHARLVAGGGSCAPLKPSVRCGYQSQLQLESAPEL